MRKSKSIFSPLCILLAVSAFAFAFASAPAYADATPDATSSVTEPVARPSESVVNANGQGAAAPAAPAAPATSVAPTASPYQLKLQYTGEEWDNAQGGIHDGTVYMQNVDAQLRVDADRAFGWTGGRFLVDGFYNSSRSLDAQYTSPAIQDPSWIDTTGATMFRFYQAYYDQYLSHSGTDILAGIYDPQTEFAHTKPMEIFFNGAYGWNTALDQSGGQGLNGPSAYPDTALGTRVRQSITNEWSVQATVLDGMADSAKNPGINAFQFRSTSGAFGIGEVDYTPAYTRTKIMAGYWGYTGKFDTQDELNPNGTTHQVWGSNGGYIGGATRLYELEGKRGLDGFANIGFADPVVNQTTRSFNAGLTFTGPIDARPEDKVGFAVGVAQAGDGYRKAQTTAGYGVDENETNFELTYRAPILDGWVTLQPDVQYWIHPGYDPNAKDDLLIGVHFEIGHLFNM